MTYLAEPPADLGQLELLSALAPVLSAGIQAGGVLGAAAITANANKSIAQSQATAALQTAIVQAQAQVQQEQIAAKAQAAAQPASQLSQLTSGSTGQALLVAIGAGLVLKLFD
jgi:cell division septum initiation protein DivIVA